MEPEIISRVINTERWFWYVYYDAAGHRREVGMFASRRAARDAALDDVCVIQALTRRELVGR